MKRIRRLTPLLLAVLTGCGNSTTAPTTPTALVILAGDAQTGLTGVPLADSLVVRVIDADGNPMPGVRVTWSAAPGDAVSPQAPYTDAEGRARTLWILGTAPGEASLVATAGQLSVRFLSTAVEARPGETWRGRQGYVEYYPGTLPIVISAPHGGTTEPTEIPDRTWGTFARDTNTQLLIMAMADALEARLGGRPHVIRALIHRRKVDLNREIDEAAQQNPLAEHAWLEFQGFVEHAKDRVEARDGRGLYIDLHGHGHPIQRLELGYLLSRDDLRLDDQDLDLPQFAEKSSLRTLAGESSLSFSAMIRGPMAFGTLLENAGVPSVPSAQQPHPGDDPYFTGGYNTARHGSRDGGPIDGVQIEANWTGIRDTAAHRDAFAAALAEVMEAFLAEHYGWSWGGV